MNSTIFFLPAVLTCLLLCQGCEGIREDGSFVKRLFSAVEGEPVVPRNANSIYISRPADNTGRANYGDRLQIKLREYIDLDGRLGVTSDEKTSDLRLDSVLLDIMVQNVTFNDLGKPDKKRVRLRVLLNLRNQKKETFIFKDQIVEAYIVYSEQSPPITTEEKAMENLLDEAAKRTALKTVSGWYTELMTPREKGK